MTGLLDISLLDRIALAHPITVIGAAFVDLVAAVHRLPRRGEDLALHAPRMVAGGCGLNVARALVRLGAQVVPGIPLGRGRWADVVAEALAESGLSSPLRFTHRDNGWCLALVEPDGERTFVTVPGVEQGLGAAALARLPRPDGWVYVAGHELSAPEGRSIVGWLADAPVAGVVVDAGPGVGGWDAELIAGLRALGVIVSVNAREAALLCGGPSEADAVAFARRSGLTLVCRRGAQDAWLVEPSGALARAPCPAVSVVDTVGAGDAHAAGLLVGLASGWAPADAVALGNMVGAFSVTGPGADAAPTREALQRFVAGNRSG